MSEQATESPAAHTPAVLASTPHTAVDWPVTDDDNWINLSVEEGMKGIAQYRLNPNSSEFFPYKLQFVATERGRYTFTDEAGNAFPKMVVSLEDYQSVTYNSTSPNIVSYR